MPSMIHSPFLRIALLLPLASCEVESTTDCINPNSEDPACLRAISEKQVDYTSAHIELTSETGTFSFGEVALNASKQLTVIAKSTGERSAVLKEISNSSLDLVPPIELAGGTCATGTLLKTGESCTFIFEFKPTEAVLSKDTPLIPYSSANLSDSFTVTEVLDGTGTGTAPSGGGGSPNPNPSPSPSPTPTSTPTPTPLAVLAFAPTSLTAWANAVINTTPADITFTINNTGAGPATFTALTAGGISGLSAPLSLVSSTCGTSLAHGSSCDVVVRYRPTTAGTVAQTAVLTYNDGVASQTTDTLISVTSVNPALITVAGHDFGVKAVNSTTNQALTVTNTGDADATIGTLNSGALNLSSYLSYVSTTCGSTLASSQSCTITVRYAPTAADSSISLSLNLDYGNGAGSVTANATLAGTTPALLVMEETSFAVTYLLDFTGSGYQTNNIDYFKSVVMTNNGGSNATSVSQIPSSGTGLGVTAPFAFSASDCTTSLAKGASCNFDVKFNSSDSNLHTKTLQVNYNNGISTTNVQGIIQGMVDCMCFR